MKRALSIITTMLLTLAVTAQTKDSIDVSRFAVGYDYIVRTTDKDGNAVTDSLRTVLQVGATVTKTMGYYTHKYKVLDIDSEEYYDEYQREGMAHVPTIYLTLADRQMNVVEELPPCRYTYMQSADMRWTLLDDTLTVCGYLCHKAQTTYGGRTWYAYYTEDIPAAVGPWKLHGLPGLILRAEDGDGIFAFVMFELTQSIHPITKPVDAKTIKTKRDNIIKLRNKICLDRRYMEDPTYYLTDEDRKYGQYEIYGTIEDYKRKHGNTIRVDDITYKVNGIAVPRYAKRRTHYQPIELK